MTPYTPLLLALLILLLDKPIQKWRRGFKAMEITRKKLWLNKVSRRFKNRRTNYAKLEFIQEVEYLL